MSDQFTAPDFGGSSHSISELSAPLAAAKGWMKFVGVMFIIQGALTALSIVGIIIAWLPIWIGVLVMQSASAIERAQFNNDADALKEALARLKTYFIIQGVLYLVSIIMVVLYVVFFGAMLATIVGHGVFSH
jgi:hypothetical protein